MTQKEFILKNTLEVNRILSLIVFCIIVIIFPLMYVLTKVGIFFIDTAFLGISGIICIGMMIPVVIMVSLLYGSLYRFYCSCGIKRWDIELMKSASAVCILVYIRKYETSL